jgi:hypothetical protein
MQPIYIQRHFSCKSLPKIARFWQENFKIARFLQEVAVARQECTGMPTFFTFICGL